jgi:hypothetical protein
MPEQLESLQEINATLDARLERLHAEDAAYRRTWLESSSAESARKARVAAVAERRAAADAAVRDAAAKAVASAERERIVVMYPGPYRRRSHGEAVADVAAETGVPPGVVDELLRVLGSRSRVKAYVDDRRERGLGDILLPVQP